jgi:DNA (cytosine-5)-methyltransferase 1
MRDSCRSASNRGDRPIAIDLFAGVGGLSLGLEQAGFDVAAAVEIDPIHAAAHMFNFPECAVIPRSIAGLSGAAIRQAAGIGDRPIHLVAGGPPCQGFSLIGQRALDDPRNSLVREYVRIVRELRPAYFLFENVKGLTLGPHRAFLRELTQAFQVAGYRLVLPWRVLNAAHFGVPQDRERLFLLGARDELPLPAYPEPSSAVAGARHSAEGLAPGPSCRDALADLPDADGFDGLLADDCVPADAWGKPSDYARPLRCIDDSGWYLGYRRRFEPGLLTASMRTEHTAISRRRFAETEPGRMEPISRFFRLPPEGVSNTLRAGTDSARGAFTSPRPIHYALARCITVREMARLHGFPDWFRLHRTKWHGARQIGNAVAPPLARLLGTAILAALGIEPEPPERTLELGDPTLLALDMSQAAAHFGIEVPIARRNRKSGATKRKQSEIEAARPTQRIGLDG